MTLLLNLEDSFMRRQLQNRIIAGLPSDCKESCRRRELDNSKMIARLPSDRGHFGGELVSPLTEFFSESDERSPGTSVGEVDN